MKKNNDIASGTETHEQPHDSNRKVQPLVRPSLLKFKVDPMWTKRGWIKRLFARRVASMIINTSSETYQFGGWTGALKKAYEMVDADKFQLAHWILREAGYNCCPADVMRRAGVDPDSRQV